MGELMVMRCRQIAEAIDNRYSSVHEYAAQERRLAIGRLDSILGWQHGEGMDERSWHAG